MSPAELLGSSAVDALRDVDANFKQIQDLSVLLMIGTIDAGHPGGTACRAPWRHSLPGCEL